MVRKAALVSICALVSGCMTSISGIRAKAIQETVLTKSSIDEIERCIILSQPGGRTPYAVTVDGIRELTIVQQDAGAVMLFQMRPINGQTEVVFRRKGALVNYDDAARACYGGGSRGS